MQSNETRKFDFVIDKKTIISETLKEVYSLLEEKYHITTYYPFKSLIYILIL